MPFSLAIKDRVHFLTSKKTEIKSMNKSKINYTVSLKHQSRIKNAMNLQDEFTQISK